MNATQTPPKNYEEWLATAPMEELVKGLYDRLEALQIENGELKAALKTQDEQFKILRQSIVSHKHAEVTGECTIPAGVVIPVG